LGCPTASSPYTNCLARFFVSTVSVSTIVTSPTPRPAKDCKIPEPSPPAPSSSTRACWTDRWIDALGRPSRENRS
jgi:hypothetical protein